MRQRRRHRASQRLEFATRRARVEPDQQLGAATHPGQRVPEHIGGIAIPAVGGNDHYRAAQRVAVWWVQQASDTAPDERAAVPVGDFLVGALQAIRRGLYDLRCDARTAAEDFPRAGELPGTISASITVCDSLIGEADAAAAAPIRGTT